MPHFYPVRERLFTQSLNGTWKIKIIKGLEIPTDYHRWKDNDYDDKKWDNIIVPGNWETQGLKFPEYGKDLEPYTGLYRTTFKYNPTWEKSMLFYDLMVFIMDTNASLTATRLENGEVPRTYASSI